MPNITLLQPQPPYGALIFDCDGTLADTMPVHFQTWLSTLRSMGADLEEEWFYARRGVSGRELIRILNDTHGYDLDLELFQSEVVRRYCSLAHTVKEITAVTAIVRSHRGQAPMALASGGARALIEATLDALGLNSFFDVVVTFEDAARGKPAPDLFLRAAERLGVAPAECIVYEDSDEGLEAAHRAGMRAVDVRLALQEDYLPGK